jgi:tol-pal system protein YbgF
MATTHRRPTVGCRPWALALSGPALAAVLHGCMAAPLEEDPAYQRLDGRLVRVERMVDNQGLLNLQNQLDQLMKENRALRDEVEKLRHDVDAASERQRQQYLDLDQRFQGRAAPVAAAGAAAGAAPGFAAGAAVGAEAAAESAAAAGADRTAYQAAFDLLKQGKYDESAAAFRDFLKKYPGSGLADNAQYWLGESYYVSQKYKEALAEFDTVLSRYPDSRKTPDALLKAGFCHYELKQWPDARRDLSGVVQKFPGTAAAKLASQRLEQMAREGH